MTNGKGHSVVGEEPTIFNGVIREGLFEKATFEQRSKEFRSEE